MDWQLGTLNSAMTPLYVALIRTPPDRRNGSDVEIHRDRAFQSFSTLNDALEVSPFLAGTQLTLADICLGMFAYRWFTLPLDRGAELPMLRQWFERLQERPAFRRHIMIGLS